MRYSILFPLLLVSVLFFAGCNPVKDISAAEKAVADFHTQLDKSDFSAIYSAAHPDFKSPATEKDFLELLGAIHKKLGAIQTSDKENWNINSFNLKTNVVLVYHTKFAGGDASEKFTYRIEGDKALLLGYNINSQALIVK